MSSVVLVNMPFAAVERPSIALGALKGMLLEKDISCSVIYANIDFASKIGLRSYYFINSLPPVTLVGDWIFSAAAFEHSPDTDDMFLSECQKIGIPGKPLMAIREHVTDYIDELAEQLLLDSPKIVGCSSTFQQHCASLALLKRIKEKNPCIVTMMGGVNCDGSMGIVTHKYYKWVDITVSGEGDEILPTLCKHILGCDNSVTPKNHLPGVIFDDFHTKSLAQIGRARVEDLSCLPFPNYDEYFLSIKAAGFVDSIIPTIMVESSRGCWWGQHKQCSFCGTHPESLKYRYKNAKHVFDEINTLVGLYHIRRIELSDFIMPMEYFSNLLPALAERTDKLNIRIDTIASLNAEHIRKLSQAGATWIQPGIENLDDELLHLLNKGTTAWKNIQLLKSCQKYCVFVGWNFIVDILGDSPELYERIIDWLPLIFHLQPPLGVMPLRYDRYSPFQMKAKEIGLSLQPFWSYKYVYTSLSAQALNDIAYFFQEDVSLSERKSKRKDTAISTLQQMVENWKDQYFYSRKDIIKREISPDRPSLCMQTVGSEIIIEDTRPCAVEKHYSLTGLIAEIYRICDKAPTFDGLKKMLKKDLKLAQADIEAGIDYLVRKKLLLQLKDRLISLAVEPAVDGFPPLDDCPAGLVLIPRQHVK